MKWNGKGKTIEYLPNDVMARIKAQRPRWAGRLRAFYQKNPNDPTASMHWIREFPITSGHKDTEVDLVRWGDFTCDGAVTEDSFETIELVGVDGGTCFFTRAELPALIAALQEIAADLDADHLPEHSDEEARHV
ncbi:glycoside hydrolase family 32 protein [Acidipropionibacterium jensenii]|uniref:glycoside hydrolase family 32 protein n=1 Tax=Acidipropionibacterium jensenii TaxID=1749 RepID=UPI00110BE589|nr:glycoside hydrolase family 32 protein [Acidipropionibacterium jensenii]QCV88452.1 glycoside hydrolase family 32 protein [Acidipropionibacterium jensenii]